MATQNATGNPAAVGTVVGASVSINHPFQAARLFTSFTAPALSATVSINGCYCFYVWGTPVGAQGESGSFTGSVQLEESPDNGTTWIPVSTDGTGTPAVYTTAVCVRGKTAFPVLMRVNCTALSAGTIATVLAAPNAG